MGISFLLPPSCTAAAFPDWKTGVGRPLIEGLFFQTSGAGCVYGAVWKTAVCRNGVCRSVFQTVRGLPAPIVTPQRFPKSVFQTVRTRNLPVPCRLCPHCSLFSPSSLPPVDIRDLPRFPHPFSCPPTHVTLFSPRVSAQRILIRKEKDHNAITKTDRSYAEDIW